MTCKLWRGRRKDRYRVALFAMIGDIPHAHPTRSFLALHAHAQALSSMISCLNTHNPRIRSLSFPKAVSYSQSTVSERAQGRLVDTCYLCPPAWLRAAASA